jgi:hypothetical protein
MGFFSTSVKNLSMCDRLAPTPSRKTAKGWATRVSLVPGLFVVVTNTHSIPLVQFTVTFT